MESTGQEEFYLTAWGGIIVAGSLILIVLIAFIWKLKGVLKRKNIIKELYGERERKNGQSKGGSHGHY